MHVIPANAGIQSFFLERWIPAFAGMTNKAFGHFLVSRCTKFSPDERDR